MDSDSSVQGDLIKIARVSQEIRKVLADATARYNGVIEDLSRAQFWLDKIIVTSGEILALTINAQSGSTLNEQLDGWISANGPFICLMALVEMKRIIGIDRPEKSWTGRLFSLTPANDKIHEAVKVLHDRRHYFDHFLASNVWKRDSHQLRATSPVTVHLNASLNSLSGQDTRYGGQGWRGIRDLATGVKWQDGCASLSPSQETVVDNPREENFEYSTPSIKDWHYKPKTRMEFGTVSSVIHDRQATQVPRLPERSGWDRHAPMVSVTDRTSLSIPAAKSRKNDVPSGNVSHAVEFTAREWHEVQIDLAKLDTILQWLDAFRCFEKHRTTLSLRQADTCTWLPETNEYKAWLAGNGSFLWLQGKAGCGKSVLVASVIQRLEKTSTDDPLAFFYCDFGKERSMDATEVIRSLLYQLVDQCRWGSVKPGVLQVVDDLVEEGRKGDATLRDMTHLSSLVSCVVEQFRRPPLIIIDALDECRDVDCLLHALLELKTTRVRLFMSSRPIQVIKHRFKKLPYISMDKMAEAVSADIVLHVTREIDSHPRLGFLDPVLKKKAHSTLCRKADGMFRWVQCQLDALKECVTIQQFSETLNNLPIGLYATYERILVGINRRPSEAKLVQRTLTWLMVTSRPLVLMEVIEALRIDPLSQTLDRGDAPIHGYALLEALGSLVVHDEEKTDVVNLSHFSVKEYLIGESTREMTAKYHINLRVAHKQVFLLCMCYLVASLNRPFDDDETPQSRPLVDYVFSCGFDHLAYLQPTDDAILGALITLRSEIQKHPLEWTHMCRMASLYHPYKTWITPEHDFVICVLISMFHESFLHAFLRRVPRTAKYALNPLVHTVHLNKVEHAKALLSHGVDVNSVGLDVDVEGLRRDLRLPLEVALRRENDTFVDLFLKEGNAAIPRTIYSTIFDGHHCNYSPHFVSSLIQADEFAEWAAEVQDDRLLRALSQGRYARSKVMEKDLLVMIRRFVQIWRDTSSLDSSTYILLMVAFASSGGHLAILEYLISINAPIPSGIMFSEETAPVVRNLIQGLVAKNVAAKGDAMLHKALGQCTGGSQCWVLECNLCSTFRSTLLTALGPASEKTLIKILITSRELVVTLSIASTRYVDNLEIPRVLSCLQKIILASGALLQAINKSFLHNSGIDRRSKRWLSRKEPNVCLEILQQMMELTRVETPADSEQAVAKLDGSNTSDSEEPLHQHFDDKLKQVVTLFNEQKNHFDFLLVDHVDKDNADSRRRRADSTVPDISQGGGGALDTVQAQVPIRPPLQSERGWNLSPSVERDTDRWASIPERETEIDVIFVGQTGVGKSSLINMIMGVQDSSRAAAAVSNDARPCTSHTSSYSVSLDANSRCRLWDTRGLDEVAGVRGSFMDKLVDRILQLASQQARELKETLRDRIRLATPILVWCIDATRIDVDIHWQQFQKVYVEYCERKAIPVVVITRGRPRDVDGWGDRCAKQIQRLNLGVDVPIRMMRLYRNSSSPEYGADSKALRDLISGIIRSVNE